MQALLSPDAKQYEVLLAAGTDPDAADSNGDTPLHVAARTNHGGATFQSYYFGYNRAILNNRALEERRQVVARLKANGVPLAAAVGETDLK